MGTGRIRYINVLLCFIHSCSPFIYSISSLQSRLRNQGFNTQRSSLHNSIKSYASAGNRAIPQKNVRKQNYSAKASSARVPSSAPFFDLTTLRPRGERPTRLVHPDDRVSEIRPACPVDGRGKSRVELGAGKGGS